MESQKQGSGIAKWKEGNSSTGDKDKTISEALEPEKKYVGSNITEFQIAEDQMGYSIHEQVESTFSIKMKKRRTSKITTKWC